MSKINFARPEMSYSMNVLILIKEKKEELLPITSVFGALQISVSQRILKDLKN